MRNGAVAALLVVVVTLSAGTGYPFSNANERSVTSVSTITAPPVTVTTTSLSTISTSVIHTTTTTVVAKPLGPYAILTTKNNLRMELILNTSRVPLGGAVEIVMNLTNVLNTHSQVSTGSAWPLSGLGWPPDPCKSEYVYPVGLAIFAGYYVVGNMSSGMLLYIAYPGTIFCPSNPSFSSYTFEPTSNVAILTDVQGSMIRVHSSTAINGSWSGGSQPKFSQFSPGVYTVVEGDQWGDVLLLYFRIG